MSRKLLFIGIFLISLCVGLYLLNQRTNFFGRASGTEANLVIDTSVSLNESNFWKNFAQGGEEARPMLGGAQKLITDLDPEFIRLDHIYDFYGVVGRDPAGMLTFDWTQLDVAVDQILATGATPFLSLSYMPKALAESDIDTPYNWSEWEVLVQRTVEHYSGTRKIPNMYYEVWNEPDLFGEFKTYGPKNYLDLYWHSSIGAARAQNVLSYKLGGPATTALYPNWFTSFVEFVQSRNLKLDFYSWHRYDLDATQFEEDLINAKRWIIEEGPEGLDIELIISEMGHNSANDPGYDNGFGAIHSLASLVALDGIDKAFSFELVDGPGPQKLWGRWGIITHEKYGLEAKPRYKAFTFLNNLKGGYVNVIGEGSWVRAMARKQNGVTRVLVVNYDPSGKHSETVPVNFVNTESPNYLLRRTDFSGKISEKQVAAVNGTVTSVEYFSPNSASIFELIPQ